MRQTKKSNFLARVQNQDLICIIGLSIFWITEYLITQVFADSTFECYIDYWQCDYFKISIAWSLIMGIACCCNCICKSSWSFKQSQIKVWAGPSHWFFDPSKGLRLDLSEKSPCSHHRSGVELWQIQIQIQIHWSIVFVPCHICMWWHHSGVDKHKYRNCIQVLYLSAAIFVRKVGLLLLSLVLIRSDKWCTIKSIVSNLQQQQLQTFQKKMRIVCIRTTTRAVNSTE